MSQRPRWRLLVLLAVGYVTLQLSQRPRWVVVPLLVALFLTALLGPPVNWLRARGWPSLAATWTVVLGAIALLAAVAFLIVLRVLPQAGELATQAVAARLGVDPVPPANPYWAEHGLTFEDPDGFRVVLVPEP
jgi:predicted PurR-regulated permease PerM